MLGRRLDPTVRAAEGSGQDWTQFCDPAAVPGVVGAAVPDFSALDQDGLAVTPDDFHGIPWISDFIFTSCTGSCPALTGRLVALQQRLASVPVRFISFSVDPEHDSPPVMKAYAERWHGDPVRWRLLSTDRETLGKLGAALGGAETPEQALGGAPFHADRFALVDGKGRLLGLYASSSSSDVDRLVADARDASRSARRQTP